MYRAETVTAGLKGYKNQCEKADSGGTPLHRPRQFNRQERMNKKALTKIQTFRLSHICSNNTWICLGKAVLRSLSQKICHSKHQSKSGGNIRTVTNKAIV